MTISTQAQNILKDEWNKMQDFIKEQDKIQDKHTDCKLKGMTDKQMIDWMGTQLVENLNRTVVEANQPPECQTCSL